jgi:hypothetical protein
MAQWNISIYHCYHGVLRSYNPSLCCQVFLYWQFQLPKIYANAADATIERRVAGATGGAIGFRGIGAYASNMIACSSIMALIQC